MYLGMKLDKDLSWKVHIKNMHRQCSAKLAIIRRACHHLPQKVCSRHLSFPTLTTARWFGITVVPFCPNAWKDANHE